MDGTPSCTNSCSNGERRSWTRVVSFRNAGPNDAVYLLDPKDGTIRFGDGAQGRRPQVGATISVTYRDGAGSTGNISKRVANASQITKFWVVVGPGQQAVGWGKRPC
jgi:hypothetical protein